LRVKKPAGAVCGLRRAARIAELDCARGIVEMPAKFRGIFDA
jgi:hypothetical protein